MKLPCEECIWKLVPMIKKEIVLTLYNKKKVKQADIAKIIHMSKAAISHYIKGRRAKVEPIKNKKAIAIIDKMADELIKGTAYSDLKKDFCDICKILQKSVLSKKLC